MQTPETPSRRDFLNTAVIAATLSIVPSHVLGGPDKKAPSDTLNIAGIGAGGMGNANIMKCARNDNIVALCDVDDKRATKTYEMLPDAKRYRDFRVMLDKHKDIDAVVIATPDHTHAVIALTAMQQGKHVFVQKPLTRTVGEARLLTRAARKYNVATQMGNQGHASLEVRALKEWLEDGAIGEIHEVHCYTNRPIWPQATDRPRAEMPVPAHLDWDLWLGPAPHRPYNPAYAPFKWRGWIDFGSGALGDMGCHVIDPAYWGLDLTAPEWVEASRIEMSREAAQETYPLGSIVHFQFPERNGKPAVRLTWYDGGLRPPRPDELEPDREMPRESGTVFVGDKGSITCGTYGEHPQIVPHEKMKAYQRPPARYPRIEGGSNSIENDWIIACKGGRPACSNFDYSGPFTETVLLGNLAVLYPYKRLFWDDTNLKVINDDNASRFVKPEYREGWKMEL